MLCACYCEMNVCATCTKWVTVWLGTEKRIDRMLEPILGQTFGFNSRCILHSTHGLSPVYLSPLKLCQTFRNFVARPVIRDWQFNMFALICASPHFVYGCFFVASICVYECLWSYLSNQLSIFCMWIVCIHVQCAYILHIFSIVLSFSQWISSNILLSCGQSIV